MPEPIAETFLQSYGQLRSVASRFVRREDAVILGVHHVRGLVRALENRAGKHVSVVMHRQAAGEAVGRTARPSPIVSSRWRTRRSRAGEIVSCIACRTRA